MNSYYNTVSEKGEQLKLFEEKAEKQEGYILTLFQSYEKLSASQIYKLIKMKWPITSVRRSLTDLMLFGHLEKTDQKVKGLYGRNETIYKIIKK